MILKIYSGAPRAEDSMRLAAKGMREFSGEIVLIRPGRADESFLVDDDCQRDSVAAFLMDAADRLSSGEKQEIIIIIRTVVEAWINRWSLTVNA